MFGGCNHAIVSSVTTCDGFTLNNVTADIASFQDANYYLLPIYAVNSIIRGDIGDSSYWSTDHTAVNPPGTLFQTNGNDQYYLPADSSFIDAGNTTADKVGLYYYTTQTNQTIEGISTVDLGYHYAAVDANGNPVSTLVSGVPDYISDTDGNGLPDAWETNYFGYFAPSASDDSDGDGVNNLQEYLNGTDPNKIQFTLSVTNNYVRTNTVRIPVQIQEGVPFYMAILVDNTNLSSGVWTYKSPYFGVLSQYYATVNLGANQGWHDIWIGLKGLPTNATTVWQWKRMKYDTAAPQLVITGPTNNTVDVPLIQVQGFSPEALGSITYDITNALGVETNQQVLILDQSYSTNTWEFTTNTFQAFDVLLTNGVNILTFHANDLAGNVTTTNFSFTVDYSSKTNPPVLQLTMPLDGMRMCGGSCTLRGQVDDPTVTVLASVTDSNGDTNVINGLVERNGRFWVENLPLNSGTNSVSITVSNAAGNMTVTNINLVQSSLTLTLTPVADPSQLWQPTLSVGGNISDPGYAVWVNGVQGTNNGDTTWSAANVPVTPGGVAVFDVTAYPPGEAPACTFAASGVNPRTANAQNASTNADKPVRLYFQSYTESRTAFLKAWETPGTEQWSSQENHHWTDGAGGAGSATVTCQSWEPDDCITSINWTGNWPTSSWENVLGGFQQIVLAPYDGVGVLPPYTNTPDLQNEHCEVTTSVGNANWLDLWTGYPEDANCSTPPGYAGAYAGAFSRHAQGKWHLQTGGKAGAGRQNLFQLTASAAAVLDKLAVPSIYGDASPGYAFAYVEQNPDASYTYSQIPTTHIPPQNITINGQAVGADGSLWLALPDGQDLDVTPRVKNQDFYTFTVNQQKYKLYIQANSHILWQDHINPLAKFCVGQYVNFTPAWNPPLPAGTQENPVKWVLGGTYVNTNVPSPYWDGCPDFYSNNPAFLQSETTHAWWIDGQYNPINLTATFGEGLTFANGQYVAIASHGLFSMHRPRLVNYTLLPAPCNPNPNTGTLEHFHVFGQDGLNHDRLGYGGPEYVDETNRGYQPAYTVDIGCSTNFNGFAYITQLLNGYATNSSSTNGINTQGTYELDNSEIYRYPNPGAMRVTGGSPSTSKVALKDMPGLTCVLHTALNQQFIDYIRFQPDGGIYVTLGTVSWNVAVSTDYDSNNHDFTPILPSGATTYPCVMTTGTGHTDTSPTAATTFPYWDHTVFNQQ